MYRYRADAAFHSRRQNRGQDAGQHVGVLHSARRSPIRKIDLLLHPRLVERTIGKPVQGEDVKTVFGEKVLKCLSSAGRESTCAASADNRSPTPKDSSGATRSRIGNKQSRRFAITSATSRPHGCWCNTSGADGPRSPFSRGALPFLQPVNGLRHQRFVHLVNLNPPKSSSKVTDNSPPRCSRNSVTL